MNMDTPELGAVAVITALFMWGPTFGARRAGYVGRGGAIGAALAAIVALCAATLLLGGDVDELGEVAIVSGGVALAMTVLTRNRRRRPVMAKLADEQDMAATPEPALAGQAQSQQGQQQQQWQRGWHQHHKKHWACGHKRWSAHAHHVQGRHRRGPWRVALWVALIGAVVWYVHDRKHEREEVAVVAGRFEGVDDHVSLRDRLRQARSGRSGQQAPSTLEIRLDEDRMVATGCDADDVATAVLTLVHTLAADDGRPNAAPPSVVELERIEIDGSDDHTRLGDISRIVRYRNSSREDAEDTAIHVRYASDAHDSSALDDLARSLESQPGFAELGWSVAVDNHWIWLRRDLGSEFPGIFTGIPLDQDRKKPPETNVDVDSPQPADEPDSPKVAAVPALPSPPESPVPPKPTSASASPKLPTTPVPPQPPAQPATPSASQETDPVGSLLERLVDAALERARSAIDDTEETTDESVAEAAERVETALENEEEKQGPKVSQSEIHEEVEKDERSKEKTETNDAKKDEGHEAVTAPAHRVAQDSRHDTSNDHSAADNNEAKRVGPLPVGASRPHDSAPIELPPEKPKPDWADTPPRLDDSVWYVTGSTGPLLQEQCTRAMSQLVEQMTRNYAADYLEDEAREIDVPVAYVYENFVKDSWIGRWEAPPTGIPLDGSEPSVGENLYECHVLMEFDDRARTYLTEQWHSQQVRGRLGFVGILAGSVLALIGTVFGYLKIDTATRGFYSGRLKLAAATVAAGIVGLAVAIVNSGIRF